MEKFILFAPLVASIIAGFGWRVISEKGAQYLATAVLFFQTSMTFGAVAMAVAVMNLGERED